MRKINGQPVDAITDISDTEGGEVLKWDASKGKMVWELQDGEAYIPIVWYGGRGIWAGGETSSFVDTIQYLAIDTLGNASDFGDLTEARNNNSGCSDGSRGVSGLGWNSSYAWQKNMDYITISTTGNATDFGDLTELRFGAGCCSDGTKGLWGGGTTGPSATTYSNVIDYITIASTGNGADFGDLTVTRGGLLGAVSDGTKGIFGGGYSPSKETTIDYVTISSTGNAADFGDLTVARAGIGSCGDTTRGLFVGGGYGKVDVIDYITMSSTGNATDFGNLLTSSYMMACSSNGTRGVLGGDANPTDNTIEYVTIQTTGNAADFGNLVASMANFAAFSGD